MYVWILKSDKNRKLQAAQVFSIQIFWTYAGDAPLGESKYDSCLPTVVWANTIPGLSSTNNIDSANFTDQSEQSFVFFFYHKRLYRTLYMVCTLIMF